MKISKRARLINFVLRLLKVQQRLADFDTGMRFLARDRKNGPAGPIGWFRKHGDIKTHDINGHRVYEYEPRERSGARHIFYLHGGGYAFNITSIHWRFIRKLIKGTGASVTVPLYPLAPEHNWATSYPIVLDAYERAAAKYGAENITVMGDSAGGGYSLGLAQMLRDQGKDPPGKIILLSPWLDATASDPRQQDLEKHDVLLSVEGTKTAGQFWAGEGNDPAAFPASPLFASLRNLPKILTFAGSHDLLYTDAQRLVTESEKAGVRVELITGEQMQHVWMLLPIREAIAARARIIAHIKS
ncbi:alpha/beta hydrolase [Parasphingorhabdus sp.]|uniref:alpha/beta hydrolase n=1 Tax=Parasphingorhabdus sp. TaxID=2709688 RepID=UPI003265709F